MDCRITENDRARFKRCRRQWDFASPHRRDLAPVGGVDAGLTAPLKDALAAYYYPGTWDWPHELKQSLVHKALKRALDDSGETHALESATALLDSYDAWATTVDDFAPVKIDHDVQALVPDPRDPERGLTTPDGSAVIYTCRIDLLAIDAADEYWVVGHRIVDDWQESEALIRDEAAAAGLLGLGAGISGYGNLGHDPQRGPHQRPLDPPATDRSVSGAPRRVRQSEPSGGGRAIPQHRRLFAHGATNDTNRVAQRTAGLIRRTQIRRSRAEISLVPLFIGAEAIDMTNSPAIYPTFAPHCRVCEFSSPCLALIEGTDAETVLAQHFRRPATEDSTKPRLGQSTWGFGRGAAPPGW